jgi:citrate synthase
MPGVTETPKVDLAATLAQAPEPTTNDARPYSPGLEGVLAGETAIALVDGAVGRLLYRGYAIGDLVEHGTFAQVAELLWTGSWPAQAHLPCSPLPAEVEATLRLLPPEAHPMDALRTGVSAWGAAQHMVWPPTLEQARAVTAIAPTVLAAFARIRQGLEPVAPDPSLGLAAGFLYQLRDVRPDVASARALDAYFIVGAEHGFNASTFAALVITSTKSDLVSGICGAIGALKGPLHGGAPSEVVDQLNQIGTPEHAEAWLRDAVGRGERLMGFGHRVYKAYDPRAAAGQLMYKATPGTYCPLCRFPTYTFESEPARLRAEVLDAIKEDFPNWTPSHGLCIQCADLYRARQLSMAAAKLLPGWKSCSRAD